MALLPPDELDALERKIGSRTDAVAQMTLFGVALHRFVWAVAESFGIVRLVEWLARRLDVSRTPRRTP